MAATAMDQDRLKREAGVKQTGRKSPNSVYAYSLAWHPDETGKIGRAEMLRAADESIRALGAEGHQAVIIAHNDEPQAHVHVILNRVSPETGKMLSGSNDFRKLDTWALAYRKERGEEHLYCPARAKKAEAIQKRKNGEEVEFVRGDKTTPRNMAKDFESARSASNDNTAKTVRDQQKTLNQNLARAGKDMHKRHSDQWEQLSKDYKAGKAKIYKQADKDIKATIESVKEQYRPTWRALYRDQWGETKAFEKREKHLGGKIENAISAVVHARKLDPDSSKGFMRQAFNFLTSQKARIAALQKLHSIEQRELSAAQRQEIGAAIHGLKEARASSLKAHRSTFNADRAALIERQAQEKDELKKKWQHRSKEQSRAFDKVRRRAEAKKTSRKTERMSQEARGEFFKGKERGEFKAASQGRKSGGRSRSRKRKR
jgi:ABC-type cobalt transport system substrate-binding protein